MPYVTCKHFFDGEILYGATRVTYATDMTIHKIEALQDDPNEPNEPNDPVVYLLTPGLVDLQINGYDQWLVATGSESELCLMDARLAASGTTCYLGTLITDALVNLTAAIKRIAAMRLPGLKGLHLEGPFIGRAPGAHDVSKIIPIDLVFLAELPAIVRLVTLAPEQEHVAAAIQLLRKKGVTVALGHSVPTGGEYENAVTAGATMLTHLYNGMSRFSHRADPGLALYGLTDDRITVGLIADGIHVNPHALKLAFRAKPSRGVCIVSDTMPGGPNMLRKNGAYYTTTGILAGACVPISEGFKNAVAAGVPLLEAIKAVTSTPALHIGLSAGFIRVGVVCPLVAFDVDLNVQAVYRVQGHLN